MLWSAPRSALVPSAMPYRPSITRWMEFLPLCDLGMDCLSDAVVSSSHTVYGRYRLLLPISTPAASSSYHLIQIRYTVHLMPAYLYRHVPCSCLSVDFCRLPPSGKDRNKDTMDIHYWFYSTVMDCSRTSCRFNSHNFLKFCK